MSSFSEWRTRRFHGTCRLKHSTNPHPCTMRSAGSVMLRTDSCSQLSPPTQAAGNPLQKEIEIIRGVQRRNVVCILDEAHLLEKEMLEEFRFLLNYRFDSMSPMALVLCGQTELWDNKLRLQRYAAIRQRIDINCVLPHLDRAETEQYVHSHLLYSGCERDIFSDKALDEVFKVTTGIPRMINRVCEKSLMYSFQQQKRIIDDYMVKYVIEHEMLVTN